MVMRRGRARHGKRGMKAALKFLSTGITGKINRRRDCGGDCSVRVAKLRRDAVCHFWPTNHDLATLLLKAAPFQDGEHVFLEVGRPVIVVIIPPMMRTVIRRAVDACINSQENL